MKSIKKEDKLQDNYIGQKTAEVLAVDYDENQILAAEFFKKVSQQRMGILLDAK